MSTLPGEEARAMIREIIQRHGANPHDVMTKRRIKREREARWEALRYLVEERKLSLTRAGQYFGLDSSSVAYALGRSAKARRHRRAPSFEVEPQ